MGRTREPFVSGTDVVLGRVWEHPSETSWPRPPRPRPAGASWAPLAVLCAQPHQVVSSTFGFSPAGSGLPAPALTLGPLPLIGASVALGEPPGRDERRKQTQRTHVTRSMGF